MSDKLKTYKDQKLTYQTGAALILIIFIIGLGTAAYLLKTFAVANLKASQDQKTYKVLGDAKQALIAWSVSHPNTPGLMPYPDRNNDGNYDDTSDCYASNVNFSSSFTIGHLPLFKSDPNCVNNKNNINLGLAQDFRDATGERLWYEVSRNLLHDYKGTIPNPDGVSPIINPSIVNAPTYPWFVVRDRNGNIISDHVAAVIFAPGPPNGTQDRTGGLANADQYLDKVVMADGTPYKNYGYQDSVTNPIQEFILGEDFRSIANNDPTYKNQTIEPYYFNDRLVYITIEELIAAVEQRAAAEIKNALLNYRDAASINRPNGRDIGYFPYAARIGSNKDYACIASNNSGVLPIGTTTPANFTCSYSRVGGTTSASCDTGFSNINSISFQRSANNYISQSGACTFSGRVCSCTGAGSCTRAAQNFTCIASGSCTANSNGTITFSGGEFTSSTGSRCTLSCVDAICSGNGSGNSVTRTSCTDSVFNTGGSSLPAWIMTNKWYDYFYYSSSRGASQFLIGTKPNVDALLIGTNSPITTVPYASSKNASQTRPSCNLNDHLDSTENANGNSTFDAINTFRTHNYNDHSYIVAP